MADLKTRTPRSPGPAGPAARRRAARAATALRGNARAGLRTAARTAGPATLWREHRLMTIAVLLGLVPRVLALLAFRPALLTADSFVYMSSAVTHTLGTIRPSGYSLFLALARVLPGTLLAVTVLQHLMGLAVAVIVYALLRSRGLPGWGATLAALPTLFDVREIALESYILPDTLYCLVIMVAVALLLTRRTPRPWQCVTAGLLLAYASVLRGNGLPIVFVALAFMLIRGVGWRALTAAAVAAAIPLVGYAADFDASYGQFNITVSDGLFLWSRTTSFANCAIIKPPPQLLPLCPDREKSVRVPPAKPWSVPRLQQEPTPADYLWSSGAWWRHDAHPGINEYNDRLAMQFALDAIRAQPLGYLGAAARDLALLFFATDRPQTHATMSFTVKPHIAVLPAKYARDLRGYARTTQNTHPVHPYDYFLILYQQPVYFPGVVFFLVVIAGLAGIIRNRRRRGGLAVLPWAIAAVSIVLPALLTQSLYRYTIVAIPLACLAAGLAFARRGPVPAQSAPAQSVPAQSAPAKSVPAQSVPAQSAPAQSAPAQSPAPG
jgi:hypothetical protein